MVTQPSHSTLQLDYNLRDFLYRHAIERFGRPRATFERHISGESFTGQNCPQRSIFGLGAFKEWSAREEKKIARNLNLHLQFKANLKWAGLEGNQATIDQPTIPKSSPTLGIGLNPPCRPSLPFTLKVETLHLPTFS